MLLFRGFEKRIVLEDTLNVTPRDRCKARQLHRDWRGESVPRSERDIIPRTLAGTRTLAYRCTTS